MKHTLILFVKLQVTIEIANAPHDADVTDPSELTTEEMQAIASAIIDTYQLGELDDVLGKFCFMVIAKQSFISYCT